jgi:hypothetical protein
MRWKRSTVRLGSGRLHAAAEVLRKTTGLHVEVMPAAAPRRGKHVGTVRILEAAIDRPCPWA